MRSSIVLLTTGGTIAALPAQGVGYKAGLLPPGRLLDSVPNITELAGVSVEAHADVGSQDVDQALWGSLAQRVRALCANDTVDGIVITHGTDTLEETAYFLHLVTRTEKPVVLTGAMRPAHAVGADGPANLQAAVAAACCPDARDLGVVVVMDDLVHDAVAVQKDHTTSLAAFSSRDQAPLGRISEGRLAVYPGRRQGNPAGRALFAHSALESWPVVHILYAYAGVDPAYVDAMLATKPDGVVVAGVGNGNASQAVWRRLAEAAAQGVAVVRATRTMRGCVEPGVEVPDEEFGFLAAGGLSPQKARILLMCALREDRNPQTLKALFLGI